MFKKQVLRLKFKQHFDLLTADGNMNFRHIIDNELLHRKKNVQYF
jgi:hypothetical protein